MTRAPKTQLHSLLLATSCLIGSSLLAVAPAMANPTGGNIVSGSGTIHKSGGTTTIDQTSGKAFIDWNSFSIGANQTVKFDAPGKNSVTVNDVTGGDPTKIFGELLANGRIWLINGNGILFGKGSIVNVGSLIATTSDLSDDDFKKGKFAFRKGNPNASVINKGTITASDGGYVVMSAAHVANEGVVQANLGKVVLGGASAFTVDLKGDNLIRYQITAPATKSASVSNSGTIEANGGTVLMTSRAASSVQDNVINNTGMVEATSVSSHDGEVDLDAGANGTVEDTGTVDVAGRARGETGGTVTMTGRDVVVADGARINAQGHNGGGTVLIGGGFHGQGPLYQATNVTIGKAVINVSATHRGDGGKVAVWSRGDTSFAGTIVATGGAYGGNGGYVETSGHNLGVTGSAKVSTAAVAGSAAGTWLLDPSAVTIENSGSTNQPPAGADIAPSAIEAALVNGNVTIEATGSGSSSSIIVFNNITYDSAFTLSLLSEGYIAFETGGLQNSGSGAVNLVAGWDGTTGVTGSGPTGTTVNMSAILAAPGTAYGLSGGSVTIGADDAGNTVSVGSAGGTTTVAAQSLTVNGSSSTGGQLGYDGNGGGNIVADVTGNLTLVDTSAGGYAQIGNGDLGGTISGATNITGNITLNVAGTTSIQDAGGETVWIGNVAHSGGVEKGDVSLITGEITVENDNSNLADGTLLGDIISADLGTSSSTGGNVLIGFTDTTGNSIIGANGDSTISDYFTGGLSYNSPHSLSLFSTNSLTVGESIQNTGSGAINLVAGWDGITTSISTILSDPDYGANSGSILINGGASVGSESGTTSVAGDDVTLDGAQIGFHGGGGTGAIKVDALDDIDLDASNGGNTQIGNGGFNTTGSSGGNITVNALGAVELTGGNASGYAQIGNGGAQSNGTPASAVMDSGTIIVTAGSVSLTGGTAQEAYVQIGNGGNLTGGSGSGAHALSYAGNITVTATDGDIALTGGNNGYALVGNGGGGTDQSTESGNILVDAQTGSISLTGSTYGGGQGGFAQIGQEGTGTKTGTITAEASDDITLTGGASNGSDFHSGIGDAYAQIGSSGAGLINENITVTAGGDLTLTGGTGSGGVATDGAQIGNGGVGSLIFANTGSNENGNITVSVSGTTTIASSTAGDDAWIGNLQPQNGATSTGTTTLTTGDLDVSDDALNDFPHMLEFDLVDGNTTLEITDSSATTTISGIDNYTSAHRLEILATGSLDLEGSIQNAGSGAIYLIGGWDGTTTTPSHFTNSGVYGNNSGSVDIGNGSQTDAIYVGSEGGSLTVAAFDVKLKEGQGVPVQLGYHGNGGGNIVVDAADDLTLTANNTSNQGYVLIGNGDYLENDSSITNATGDITVNVAKQTLLDASSVSGVAIGNFAYASGGTETGNVTLKTKDLSGLDDFANFIGEDLNGGNVTIEITDPNTTTTLPGTDDYSSANTLKILAEGSLVFQGNVQNSGSGAIDLVAGWSGTTTSMTTILANPGVDFGLNSGNITVSPTFGTGGAALGSASGTTTVAADNIFVEGNGAGFGQIGYHGTGGGTIDVQATGNVTVESGGDEDFSGDAQIGNGDADNPGGNATGNITVNAGGSIEVETASDAPGSMAAIGNVTYGDASSESGNIVVTSGGLLSVVTNGDSSVAFIGNWSRTYSTGGASGNITITSGSLNVQNTTPGSDSVIGNGGQYGYNFADAGTVSGDITIHTGTMTLTATGPGSEYGAGQVRIGNRGYGAVSGDIGITTTGDVTLQAHDEDITAIGNASYGGTSTGNINVTVGGALSLLSTDTGITSIGGYGSSGTNTTVTVTGDILLSVTGRPAFEGDYYRGGEAIIGNLAASKNAAGGNVTVASTHGSITLDSEEKYGSTQIGNTGGKATGSTITVTAADPTNGSIELLANGKYSFSQIGSRGIESAAGSKIIVTSGSDLEVSTGNDDAIAQIGNGTPDMDGNASGNLTIKVGGDLTISSSDSDAAAVIGNGDPFDLGTGSASGNISVTVTGGADLAGPGLVWVGNLADTGVESGNVSITAFTGEESGGVDFDQMMITDLGTTSSAGSGGNVTVGFTDPAASINLGGNLDYNSPHSLELLTAGSIDFTGSLQNSGAGNVTIVAGWNPDVAPSQVPATAGSYGNGGGSVTIGGASANGNASVGSDGGTTTVLADDVTLDSENGYAQLGYHGDGTGDIDVDATGNITLTGNTSGGFVSQIGNGGSDVTGNMSGNVTLVTTGGTLNVDAMGSNSIATIGALSDGGSNESGNISINTHGGALNLASSGTNTYAQIGNWAHANNTGTLSGGVTIDAGAISLDSTGASSSSQIGNGNYLGFFSNSGAISGNIDINATTLSVTETAPTGGFEEARIGNLGEGPVNGTVTITTTGNITVSATGDGAAAIGDFSEPFSDGGPIQGEGSSSIDIQSGGNISISSNGASAASGIVVGGATSGTITLTAHGNITVTSEDAGFTQIGSEILGDGAVSVDVTSKTGNVDVETDGSGSSAQIGNSELLTSGAVSGDVTVTATDGNIVIAANNSDSDAIHIGDTAAAGGTASGNITLTAGNVLDIVNSSGSVIGNSGGSETGDVTITAVSLTGDISPSIENDLPGGDFILTLTGDDTLTLSADVAVDSAHNLILSNGGDIDFAGSVQNSGTGDITVNSAGTVLVGGTGATGDVSVGSAGGTTTVLAKNVLIEADNGYAQIGFDGASGGDIDIVASGTVTLDGGSNTSLAAQIGNGSTLDSSSAGGNIDLTAHSVNASGSADVAGSSADITLTGNGGHIGSASDPLGLAVNTLAILASGANAYLTSPQGLSIGVGSNGIDLGSGNLVLTASGPVTQTDAIVAGGIDIDATSGAITLTDTDNTFDTASLTTTGDASLYDSTALTIAGATIGGTLTLSDAGNIGQSGAIDANTLDVTSKHGSITLSNTGNTFSTATLSASKNASLYDASDLTITGATVGNTLTLAGGGNIGQSGAIDADTLDVTTTDGSITLTDTGNTFTTATLSASKNASLHDASDLTITGASVGNTLTLTDAGSIGQSGAIAAKVLDVKVANGAIALTNAGNAIGTASLSAKGDVSLYDSESLTVSHAATGGDLTLLTEGNLTFVSSVQLNNGDILAVAGWDGTTTSPSALTQAGAFGNNGGSIVVGGAQASGDVAIGSEKGTVTLAGDDVSLEAQNGYAQIGYHGSGQGDIDVLATGNVTLDGGGATGEYAQIGNGGYRVSGNESGNITVDAGGNVTLDGGSGEDAYAQIGHGGADADKNSHGYTNSGSITVEGQTIALMAGAGDQSYAQIGNGGFDLGDGLTGQGVTEGNITVTAVDGVSLTGDGTDAYAQIGNGGDQVNANAGSSAGGSIAGDIVVDVTGTGSVTITAGAGDNSYVQIGNGGFSIDSPTTAPAANFTISGSISVSDLTLAGSDTGADAYAQVGNGDASLTGLGDVSGNITIDSGEIKLTDGTANDAPALIGNAIGDGTVTGTITGYTPPNTGTDPGTIVSLTAPTPTPINQQLNLVIGSEDLPPPDGTVLTITTPDTKNPLQTLANDSSYEGQQGSDTASGNLGRSLNGQIHAQTIIPGVLTELTNTATPHGIPPADQNFSSWGNEALWTW